MRPRLFVWWHVKISHQRTAALGLRICPESSRCTRDFFRTDQFIALIAGVTAHRFVQVHVRALHISIRGRTQRRALYPCNTIQGSEEFFNTFQTFKQLKRVSRLTLTGTMHLIPRSIAPTSYLSSPTHRFVTLDTGNHAGRCNPSIITALQHTQWIVGKRRTNDN